MNLLCLDQFSNLGGGQRSLLDLLPAFVERGWQPAVVAPGDGPLHAAARKLGLYAHSLEIGDYESGEKPLSQILTYASRMPAIARQIHRLVRARKVNLIYVNAPRLLPPAALMGRFTRVPVVFHCHNRLHQRSALSLAGYSVRLAKARVIACCEHVASPLRPLVTAGRLSVIYNGVAQVPETSCRANSAAPRIGVIGRIESEKGQLEFVRAARLVRLEFPKSRFSVIGAPMFSGDAYYKQVVRESEGLSIDFRGWQDDLSSVFADLDMVVVPSSPVEATTRVILEAYSAGVAVVAFPAGGIPEIVRDRSTGFLASHLTPEALACRILSVLRMDRDVLSAVLHRAKSYWSENFQLSLYRERVCDVLRESLTRHATYSQTRISDPEFTL